MNDHFLSIAVILVLLGVANGTPVFATWLLGKRLDTPLDGGLKFPDGRPLFGPSKTVRGLVLSVSCTALAAALLGPGWITGAALATASMAGDLLSSFIKRRLGLRAHSQALGLDQVPESLLPLLLLQQHLGLGHGDIAVLVAAFIVLELVLSRLLFRLHIRDRVGTLFLQPHRVPQRIILQPLYKSGTQWVSNDISGHVQDILLPVQGMIVIAGLPNRMTCCAAHTVNHQGGIGFE